jgi:hypothetical protein
MLLQWPPSCVQQEGFHLPIKVKAKMRSNRIPPYIFKIQVEYEEYFSETGLFTALLQTSLVRKLQINFQELVFHYGRK